MRPTDANIGARHCVSDRSVDIWHLHLVVMCICQYARFVKLHLAELCTLNYLNVRDEILHYGHTVQYATGNIRTSLNLILILSYLPLRPVRRFKFFFLFSLRLQSPNLLSFVCAPPAVASEVDYFFHPFKKNPHNWGTIYVIVKKNLHDEMEKEKTPLRHSHPRHGPRGHCGRGRDEAPKGILTTKKNT